MEMVDIIADHIASKYDEMIDVSGWRRIVTGPSGRCRFISFLFSGVHPGFGYSGDVTISVDATVQAVKVVIIRKITTDSGRTEEIKYAYMMYSDPGALEQINSVLEAIHQSEPFTPEEEYCGSS